jgi:ferredoxin
VKVAVDRSRCTGHNRCVDLAEDLFEVDEQGFAFPLGSGEIPAGREDAAQNAADNCPEQAVFLEEGA